MLGGQRLTQTSKLLSHLLSQRGAAALSTQSLIGSQRSAVTLGGAVPGYDPTDIPHPSTRAPEGEGLSRRAQGEPPRTVSLQAGLNKHMFSVI